MEVGREPTDEEIRAGGRRDTTLQDKAERDAICSVDATVRLVGRPLLIARVVWRLEEGAAAVTREVARQATGDGDFVSVLHVCADGGGVEDDRNSERFKLSNRTDPRELQELGRVKGTGGDNDLTSSEGGSDTSERGAPGAGICTEEMAAGCVFNANSARPGESRQEENARDE